MIKLLVNNTEVAFETTIFPDGTSQVWKVSQELFEDDNIQILWLFENETELFHVCQLAKLTQHLSNQEDTMLSCPYLPYARQDKAISNTSSFSLSTFADILYNCNITRIDTFDCHSQQEDKGVVSASPYAFHQSINNHDIICFPDKGALLRYAKSFDGHPFLYCEKVRNQLTGEITGLELHNPSNVNLGNLNILIVDDICDGGMTFIKVAELLKQHSPRTIDLAVSHGLFSKAKQCLYDAGINTIYTTNSLLRNPEGFKVW